MASGNQTEPFLSKLDHNTMAPWMALPVVLMVPAILAMATSWMRKWRGARQLKSLPKLRVKWDTQTEVDWKGQLQMASSQFHDTPFVLDLGSKAPPQVVLPRCLLDEVRRRPDALASQWKDIGKLLHSRYIGVGEDHPIAREVLRKELTNHIPELLPILHDEVRDALDQFICEGDGDLRSWRPVTLYQISMDLCSQVIGRFFVGSLCKSKEWQSLAASWDRDLAQSSKAVSKLPWWTRPIVARWLPAVRRIIQHKDEALNLLMPEIAAAVERYVKARDAGTKGKIYLPAGMNVGEMNVLNWMLNYVDTTKSIAELGPIISFEILILVGGSVSGTARTLHETLIDLASFPHFAEELRAEFQSELCLDPDGRIRKSNLLGLRKLDSFLLESLRVHPHFPTALNRRVLEPDGLRLSSGLTIPYDSRHCFLQPYAPFVTPAEEDLIPTMARSGKHPPLEEFYAFRFSELRDLPGEEGAHQFTQTGPDNLNFGHGPGSCSGRWFLAALLKVIVVEILSRYELALGPDGEGHGKNGFKRTPPVRLPGTTIEVPNPAAEVHVRLRNIPSEISTGDPKTSAESFKNPSVVG